MDKDLLVYYMKKSGHSRETIAKELGITERTLSSKLNGHAEFTHTEIQKLATACNLAGSDILSVFFNKSVE